MRATANEELHMKTSQHIELPLNTPINERNLAYLLYFIKGTE